MSGFLKGAQMEAPPGIYLMLGILKCLRAVSLGKHLQWIRDIKQMLSGRFYTIVVEKKVLYHRLTAEAHFVQ